MKNDRTSDLLSMKEHEKGCVIEISGSPEMTEKLKAMGLHPGRQVTKRTPGDYPGPVTVEVMGSRIALGRGMAGRISVKVHCGTILLTGNPNVGKSVVFSRLTGLDVVSANYPGTTVSYTSGSAVLGGEQFSVVDVPGAYSLTPANRAEETARKMILEDGKELLIHVLDSTNLERNLFFALELMGFGTPMIILLNKSDIARRRGISIDAAKLEAALKIKVIPFAATTGEGLTALNDSVRLFRAGGLPAPAAPPASADEKWRFIGGLASQCQTIAHKHPSFLEKLEDFTSSPATGIPFAFMAMAAVFLAIRTAGETLINYVLAPVFNGVYIPALEKASDLLHLSGLLKTLLVGASMKPLEDFGLLTTGLYIPLVSVMPYLAAFYLVLGFMEDLGYLPRLSVLLDGAMHKLGLHGYGTIPLMLGLGCKVPAILAVRVLENRRERIIATALTLAAAPCMPQSAMILSILSPYPLKYTMAVFLALAAAGAAAGLALNRLLKGETPELFIEIPPYQMPSLTVLWSKTWLRLKDFLTEAAPMILAGVLMVNLLGISGILSVLTGIFKYPVTHLLGLPAEMVSVMTLGFLRKDVSIAMLAPFGLGPGQLVVASVFLTLYLPCLGAFMVTIRELGVKDALGVFILNFCAAVLLAGALNLLV
ncbi:MAG: fused ferrous iron transport protein A/B [Elusimicrobiales bacterium]|jgi:ferrous iron transport protein B